MLKMLDSLKFEHLELFARGTEIRKTRMCWSVYVDLYTPTSFHSNCENNILFMHLFLLYIQVCFSLIFIHLFIYLLLIYLFYD